jgi:S1-C subfamily serine protease
MLPGSPAAHAGLLDGDEVRALDGRPITEWDLPEVSALLDDGEEGRKVPMVVRRGDREIKVKLKLADVIR